MLLHLVGLNLGLNSSYRKEDEDSNLGAKLFVLQNSGFEKNKINIFFQSKSQLGQDLLALQISNFKFDGFYVEFGATDGVLHSNSYLLEKHFNWKGILSEPARSWHKDLANNRNSKIDHRCLWSTSGLKLDFTESLDTELSTVSRLATKDSNRFRRKLKESYEVITVSLEDLLDTYNAPNQIDYVSIDTEGSEFEILQNFNFQKYRINFFSVEHNYSKNRTLVFKLMQKNGFKRILPDLSKFDDWFLNIDL